MLNLKNFCAVSAACLSMLGAEAQATKDLERDGMFLEAGGHGVYWSLNYEHTRYLNAHWAMHGRVGMELYKEKHLDLLFAIPITFSASYGGSSRGEVGLGVVPFLVGGSGMYPGSTNTSANLMFPVFHAGYRYQRYDGKWFLRAGALIAYLQQEVEFTHWVWNPYLSVGLLF